jgi:hypothetical protein
MSAEIPLAYNATQQRTRETREQLKQRIPGWGVDLDPADRPSVPQERFDLGENGAHWEFPERQPEKWPRERSIEHKFVTPVFGTSCPPKGVSGMIRRLAYAKYSEARAAHWLLLIAADRVDSVESHVQSLFSLRPVIPFTETGLRTELEHGVSSRVGKKRSDVIHHPLDPVVVAGPWIAAGGLAFRGAKRVVDAVRGSG